MKTIQDLLNLFPNVRNYYEKHWLEKKNYRWLDFEKIVSKGVFPYEHMIGPDVFTETSLPSREAFKNRLKDADVTEEQYKIAQDLWDTFEVK